MNKFLILLSFVLAPNLAHPGDHAPISVVISSPPDRAAAPSKLCVSGRVSRKADIHLIVRAKGGDYYVQPAVSLKQDLTFTGLAYVAEEKREIFEGETFEIVAVANPREPLTEGEILTGFPAAEATSPLIEVVRRDSARSGCGEGFATLVPQRDRKHQNASVVVESRFLVSSRDVFNRVVSVLIVLACALFLVMIARPERAQAVIRFTTKCVDDCFGVVKSFLVYSKDSVCKLSRKQSLACGAQSRIIWRSRGYKCDFREFALNLLLAPVLWILFFVTLYPSTLINRLGLSLVLPSVRSASAPTVSGVGFVFKMKTNSNNAIPTIESRESQEKSLTNSESNAGSSSGAIRFALTWLKSLWEQDALLLAALGLAALDAALGAVLLWGLGEAEAVRISFRTLLRERPIPTCFFLTFNFAMTLLAGDRAYEVSPDDVSWVLPVIVAATLAFAMPWIMSWVLFYAFESASRCFGPCTAVILISVLAVTGALTSGIWTLLLCVLSSAMLLILSLVGLVGGLTNLYAWLADSIGDLLRWLYSRIGRGESAHPVPARILATTGALSLFLGIAAAFLNGCGRQDSAKHVTPLASQSDLNLRHDPSLSYQAWAYVLDTSESPLPEEFQRLKLIVRESIRHDVQGNDLAWLIPINGGFTSSKPFSMPPVGAFKTGRAKAKEQLDVAKAELIGEVDRLEQRARTTELTDPISFALNLLRDQPQAKQKYLIIGSDFIQDRGVKRASHGLADLDQRANMEGVHVLLLFMVPKPQYLSKFHLSVANLYSSLSSWSIYFQKHGATDSTIRNIDTLAAQAIPLR